VNELSGYGEKMVMVEEVGSWVGWGVVGSTIGDAGRSCACEVLTQLSSEVISDSRVGIVLRAAAMNTITGPLIRVGWTGSRNVQIVCR
jgi:hypothetical protein